MSGEIAGKAIIVSIKNNAGTPAYEPVLGLRTRAIKFNSESVDITNVDSTNQWRELLDATGIKSASISGDGVFKDNTASEEVREAFFAGSHRDWKFDIPDFGDFVMSGRITELTFTGGYNDAVTVSVTIESAGEVTWTVDT
jgi:TP901-1 family phage major tail protein